MNKVTVTLRAAPRVSFDIPETVERSCFGALRFFPGIPRACSTGELAYIKEHHPNDYRRLLVSSYVESRRVDRRGASEAEIERRARQEGLEHLPFVKKVAELRRRGKLPEPETETEEASSSRDEQ